MPAPVEQVHAQFAAHAAHGGYARSEPRRVAARVLQIQANRARGDQSGGSRGDILVAALQVRSHWNPHAVGDAPDGCQHFRNGDAFAIGISQRVRHARASGGNGRKTGFFDDARAGAVPGIRQHQDLRPAMQPAKDFRLFGLACHGS